MTNDAVAVNRFAVRRLLPEEKKKRANLNWVVVEISTGVIQAHCEGKWVAAEECKEMNRLWENHRIKRNPPTLMARASKQGGKK